MDNVKAIKKLPSAITEARHSVKNRVRNPDNPTSSLINSFSFYEGKCWSDHFSGNLNTRSLCGKVLKYGEVLIGDSPWSGYPTSVTRKTSIRVTHDLVENEFLCVNIGGKLYWSRSNSMTLSPGARVLDVGIIPASSISHLTMADSDLPYPLKSIQSNQPFMLYSPDPSHHDQGLLSLSEKININILGEILSPEILPTPVVSRDKLPVVLRRGVKSFLSSSDGTTKVSESITKTIPGNPSVLDGSWENLEVSIKLDTTQAVGKIADINGDGNSCSFPIEVWYETVPPNSALFMVSNINSIQVPIYASNGKSALVIPSGSYNLVPTVISHIIRTYFGLDSDHSGWSVKWKNTAYQRVSVSSNQILSQTTLNQPRVLSTSYSSRDVFKSEKSGNSRYVFTKNSGQYVNQVELKSGVRSTFIIPIPVSMFVGLGSESSLLSGNFSIESIELTDPDGRSVEMVDTIISFTNSSVKISSYIPSSVIAGNGVFTMRYTMVKKDMEGSNYNDSQSLHLQAVILKPIDFTYTIEIERYNNLEIIEFSIFSEQDSYIPTNTALRDQLIKEKVPNISATLINSNNEEIDLLQEDSAHLTRGWNTLRISKNLFCEFMVDRGVLTTDSNFGLRSYNSDLIILDNKVANINTILQNLPESYSGDIWIEIGGKRFIAQVVSSKEINLVDFIPPGLYSSVIHYLTIPYRRWANRFYQRPDVDPTLASIPGPIFYLSSLMPIPSGSNTYLRDQPPDFTWGFILDNLDYFRIGASSVRCPVGVDDSGTPDEPENLLLPTPLPSWGRWLADINPLKLVTSSDIVYNIPNNDETYWSFTEEESPTGSINYRINQSIDTVGELKLSEVSHSNTAGRWSVIRVPSDSPIYGDYRPEYGDIIYYYGFNPKYENTDITLSWGVVLDVRDIVTPEQENMYEITVVSRFPVLENYNCTFVKGSESSIISHITGGGYLRKSTSPLEAVYLTKGPNKVLIEWDSWIDQKPRIEK